MNDYELEIIFEMMNSRLKRADASGNRSAECPLSQWTHSKGKDKHPSVMAKAGEPAVYKCWACHNAGTVFKLAKTYHEYSGDSRAIEYVKSISKSSFWGKPIEYGSKYKRIGKRIQAHLDKEITEEKLKQYMELVPQYAFSRGITKAQVLKWEIGFDKREQRMIFTIRDFSGRLAGISGRDVTDQQKPKYRHYTGLKKEKLLYGERFIDRMTKKAFIVEGFMDVLAMERHGLKNTLCTMGTSMSEDQIKRIDRWFKEVIFIPDVDDEGAGRQFCETSAEALAMRGIKAGVAGVIPNPNFIARKRPSAWESIDYRFLPIDLMKDKDPADLTKTELDTVLSSVQWVKLGAVGEDRLFG